MAFLVDEWVTPDVGNRRQGKILHAIVYYKRYWVTSKNSWVSTSHFHYEEAEAGGQTFHPAHAGKYGFKAVTICSGDTDIFVMSLIFQYKISVPLIKQFGTKIMVRLIDIAKFVVTTGI